MGFSIDSAGGWLPANRPAAGLPARSARASASRTEAPLPALRSTATVPPTRSLDGAAADGPAPERLQRIRQLNPEQSLGMALYEGAGRTGGGAGRHLDLRV